LPFLLLIIMSLSLSRASFSHVSIPPLYRLEILDFLHGFIVYELFLDIVSSISLGRLNVLIFTDAC